MHETEPVVKFREDLKKSKGVLPRTTYTRYANETVLITCPILTASTKQNPVMEQNIFYRA